VIAVSLWVGLLIVISRWVGLQSYHWFPVQASNAAPLVDGLFSFETTIGTFVFLAVASVMAWVLLRHRAEKYDATDAEPIEGNTKL
jgi:cytochrome c oxidase subunit 2